MKRLLQSLALMVAAALVLSGCSYSDNRVGVRLNADDTVDFIMCSFYTSEVDVDYEVAGEVAGLAEWHTTAEFDVTLGDHLIKYGLSPRHFVDEAALPPPAEWVSVSVGYFSAIERRDLAVGKWAWFGSQWAWVPAQPCGTDLVLEIHRGRAAN